MDALNVFFSDLDNTLIFSHRKSIQAPKVLVEELDGKEQSFMTEYAYSFFRKADWLSLVPVTTRSEVQYRRLLLPDAFRIRYALICNGGKLLSGGEEDREWSEETMRLVRDDLPDLEALGDQLKDLSGREVCKPEQYYFYVNTDNPENVCEDLKNRNPKGNIRIVYDHRKVYLFPHSVNKGTAVQRFAKRYGIKVSAGAGDSIIDIPMLNEVNYPLAAESIFEHIRNPGTRKLTGEIISDQICNGLEAMHQKGII